MKKVLKYIAIFLLVLMISLGFLVATAKIPKKMIAENVKKSQRCFRTHDEIKKIRKDQEYTYLHIYADAILLNITYGLDEEYPLKSAVKAPYYLERENFQIKDTIYYDFDELVEQDLKPNTQYLRYWHGSVGILKILLIFMDLEEIYIFNATILIILLIVLLSLLFKKKAIALGISLIIGLTITASAFVPFCLEYTWTYYIMLISSILAVLWIDKQERLNKLFFITGIITCFLDFLSTEIITIVIPLLIVLVLKVKDKKIETAKEALKVIVKSLFLWGIAYVSMWFAKWIIASIVLKTNAFIYVGWRAQKRINGKILGIKANELWLHAIKRNILTLYPLNLQKNESKLLIIPIVIAIIEIIIIRKRNLKKLWFPGVILLIGILPYARYTILSNHAYTHFFFTFRSQIVTIMAIILAMIYSVDIEFWKEKRNGFGKTKENMEKEKMIKKDKKV
ncbi:MAG: hypothetical protein HFJ36_05660 [Clostridia bacterium]|nr:hypothetical protein [Clostridia bacterium]